MNRIVISGAGGFLGTHIIEEARKNSVPVLAITSNPDKIAMRDIECMNLKDFLSGNICLKADDIFINCLFPTNADGVRMANGLRTVYELIIAAEKSGVGSFINISSQSVYPSKREQPADESAQLSLETPYAVGKYSTEAFTNQVFNGCPHTNIRLASLIGADYNQRIVNRMIIQALKGETLKVIGGMQRYGFLDVRDAAAGLVKIALSDSALWKDTYNLGRNESYTLIEIADLIRDQIKKELNMDVQYIIHDGEDNRNSSIIASSFIESFNWVPKVSITQTIEDIINIEKNRTDHT